MKTQLATTVLLLTIAFTTFSSAQDYTIQSYLDLNFVTSIDYRDGTLAVGTTRGLYLFMDGQVHRLTADDGLPHTYIHRVAVAARDTFYVGPYYPDIYPYPSNPQSVYEVKLQGQELSVRDITGEHDIRNCYQVFDTGPDGSLWLADQYGIHRYDGAEWHVYQHENHRHYGTGSVFFAQDGTAYFKVTSVGVFRISGESVEQIPLSFRCGGIALDADDALWAIGENEAVKGLFRYDGADWQLVSDDPVWSGIYMYIHSDMFFDRAGRLWVLGWSWAALYEDGEVTLFEEADGLSFRTSSAYIYFNSYEPMPDGTSLFATAGAGILTYNGDGFGRLSFEDTLQGCDVEAILEDQSGRIWILNRATRTVSVLKETHWSQIDVPWFMAYQGGPYMASDINGDIWMTSDSGAARWDGSEFEILDMSNSPLDSSYAIAIDSLGKKWFASPTSKRQAGETATGAVVSFDGSDWQRYPSDDHFLSQRPIDVVTGPEDKMWFARYTPETHTYEGLTTYDGETWEHLDQDDVPVNSPDVYFDINGNALLRDLNCLYRCYPGGHWDRILDAFVSHVQSDADGRLYCAATDGLYFGEKDNWEKITKEDGLCPGWDAPAYSSSYPTNALQEVFIDHNGDKWIGTQTGLSCLRDGGPAAQKLTLHAIVGHSQGGEGETLLVSGEFINTYTTMPVSFWLACQYNGSFYFYPDWGTTMQSVDIVLPAHSIEARQLFSFDADMLPPGTYTFIGGISLRGGAHLMIGARDDKYSFASWTNE